MTPEQRAKIKALRTGEQYVPPRKYQRQMPESVIKLQQQMLFKKLFNK